MTNKERNLSITWTKTINDPSEKEQLETSIKSATTVLMRLREIAEDNIQALSTQPLEAYDTANWNCLQADKYGQVRVWNKILMLTQHIKDK